MAYLSETHGWERLVQLDASIDERSKPDEIERAIVEVYGVSSSVPASKGSTGGLQAVRIDSAKSVAEIVR
jgi:hypothetical protein